MNLRCVIATVSVALCLCCAGGSSVFAQGELVRATTDESFARDVLNSGKPVLVDFYADWCGPCKKLSPVVESLAKKYDGKVIFLKLNVDHSPKTSELYSVQAIPTLKIFKKGKVVAETIGGVPAAEIDAQLIGVLKQ